MSELHGVCELLPFQDSKALVLTPPTPPGAPLRAPEAPGKSHQLVQTFNPFLSFFFSSLMIALLFSLFLALTLTFVSLISVLLSLQLLPFFTSFFSF